MAIEKQLAISATASKKLLKFKNLIDTLDLPEEQMQ